MTSPLAAGLASGQRGVQRGAGALGGLQAARGVHEGRAPAHNLGFGRIVVSEMEAPNMLVNLV